jgi:hypothetical protein
LRSSRRDAKTADVAKEDVEVAHVVVLEDIDVDEF